MTTAKIKQVANDMGIENQVPEEKKEKKERGIYVTLPSDLDRKLDVITKVLPPRENGKRWTKKAVVALAVGKFITKFDMLFGDFTDLDSMIEKAKEINVNEIEIGETGDLSEEDAGLEEY